MLLAVARVDLIILVAYLAGVLLFGVWVGRGQRDVATYLLAGRDLPWWGVLLSIVATETSTVTFLSVPGLAYDPAAGNLLFLQLAFGYLIGRFVVVFLLLPHYFRGDLFTAYQVLDRRFGGRAKQTASLLFLVTRNLADGLRLYLTAIVLRELLHLDLALSIALLGVVTIIYTFFGGMRSVVWNDCVQFVVYMIGALLALGVIVDRLPGGWPQLVQFGLDHDKFRLFDFTLDFTRRFTFWSGLIGGVFLTLATHGTDQMMVQRYLAAGTVRKAGRALATSGFVILAQFAVFLLLGIGLACFYQVPPNAPFSKNDEVFASFIVRHLPVGLMGLTLAAVFSAAMSTLSSSLNSSATAAVNDFYLPARKEAPSARQVLAVSRRLTVIFGAIQIGVALAGAAMAESVINSVLAIASFASGTILGVFFLGVFTSNVSQRSALAGLVGGLAVLSTLVFGPVGLTQSADLLQLELEVPWAAVAGFRLAWPWYAVVGSLATFLLGLAAHLGYDRPVETPSRVERAPREGRPRVSDPD